jgi:nitroimidazol reductase NimA-like FMN-containing flavoprotein (pyridoxamine 5'-phosphate oxidase superfamily)
VQGRLDNALNEEDHMDQQLLASELDQPGARSLLNSQALLRLAYAGLDGLPRVIPIGFIWIRRRLVVCTATTSPKVKALTERPDVAITLDIGNTPADSQALLIRGTATLEVVDGVPEEYVAAASKTLAPDALPEFERQVAMMYPQMVRISVEPTWARYYDFGAGRMPKFLLDLAEQAATS